VGREQLIVFLCTLLATLATDLLVGIAVGIVVKIIIHLINGAPASALFRPKTDIETVGNGQIVLRVRQAAVFTNWLKLRKIILSLGKEAEELVVDLSDARLVDHTVMRKLEEMAQDWSLTGKRLEIGGLHRHRSLSEHPHAARVLSAA